MDIHIVKSLHDRDPIRLFVGGQLAAEIVADTALTATDWARELEQARCLKALALFVRQWQRDLGKVPTVPDHINTTPQARQAAFCRGLEEGLCGRTVPYGTRGALPPMAAGAQTTMRPNYTRAYEMGYDHGEAMARAVALALGEEQA